MGATHREGLGTGLEDYRPPHGGLTMPAQATCTPFHPPETPKLPPQALSEDWTSKAPHRRFENDVVLPALPVSAGMLHRLQFQTARLVQNFTDRGLPRSRSAGMQHRLQFQTARLLRHFGPPQALFEDWTSKVLPIDSPSPLKHRSKRHCGRTHVVCPQSQTAQVYLLTVPNCLKRRSDSFKLSPLVQ